MYDEILPCPWEAGTVIKFAGFSEIEAVVLDEVGQQGQGVALAMTGDHVGEKLHIHPLNWSIKKSRRVYDNSNIDQNKVQCFRWDKFPGRVFPLGTVFFKPGRLIRDGCMVLDSLHGLAVLRTTGGQQFFVGDNSIRMGPSCSTPKFHIDINSWYPALDWAPSHDLTSYVNQTWSKHVQEYDYVPLWTTPFLYTVK